MLHILSGALFVSILAISIGVIVATIRAEIASIRRVLGIASAATAAPVAPVAPIAYRPRVRVIKRAEFHPTQALQVRAA